MLILRRYLLHYPATKPCLMSGRKMSSSLVRVALGHLEATAPQRTATHLPLTRVDKVMSCAHERVERSGHRSQRLSPRLLQVITTSGKEGSMRDSLSLRGRGGNNFPGPTTSTNDVDGEVKGLTTASAIWITAGLGMACGAGLFFVATLGAGLTVGILKISEVITTLRRKVRIGVGETHLAGLSHPGALLLALVRETLAHRVHAAQRVSSCEDFPS